MHTNFNSNIPSTLFDLCVIYYHLRKVDIVQE
jgi:hypothetical protein